MRKSNTKNTSDNNEKRQIEMDWISINDLETLTHECDLSRPCRRLESIELKRQCDWHFNLKIHSTIFSGVCVNFEDAKLSFVLFAFEAHAICDPLTVDQFVHLLQSCPEILDSTQANTHEPESNEFIFFRDCILINFIVHDWRQLINDLIWTHSIN